ncbi:PAS domain S-box protein [Azospirillum doebereinerae]|uniref:histidine kinase n=1 Tax=Azospirillum doebereinerae TaxID=92933 RepID=A0A3S0WLC7_9PROT|nr:PAS domain S-box protein [Azospirillum doebereinerae]RUQ69732.1 PAS domain S-box protein [Azospirillum doebereinerae]
MADPKTNRAALRVVEEEIERLRVQAARLRAALNLPTDEEAGDQALSVLESVTEHAIVTTDLDGRIIGWNSGAVNNLGWSEAEALGRDAATLFFTPEDIANHRPEHEMTLAREMGHVSDERWHVNKNGRFYAQGQMTPLLDRQGAHVGYVKVFRDRTGQRMAEDAAQAAVDELRQMTDALPILIAVVGADHRYRFANRHYETWFGVPHDRIVGLHLRDLVGEEAYRDRLPQIERALAGELVDYDGYLPDKDGNRRDCNILYIPRRTAEGGVDGFYVQVVDITDRMRAAEQARRADERIHLALEAGAVHGTWVWDVVEDRFTADARFARTFSLDPAAMERGVPLAEVVKSIDPTDEPGVRAKIAAALAQGGRYRAEYRVRQLDGSYLWVEANGHVITDADGKALRFPGVLVNIEQRKVAELYQNALLDLGDRLRALDEAADVAFASAEIVGTTMASLRAGYAVADPERCSVVVERDWRADPDIPSVVGPHSFADYGTYFADLLRGEVVAITDVTRDPRTATDCRKLLALSIRSLLNVPLLDEGRLSGVFFLHYDKPYAWTEEEIAFARGVTDRTWAAMTKAAADKALHQLNDTLEQRVEAAVAERDRLWQTSRDLLVVIDREGHFKAVNPAWVREFGHAEADMTGARVADFVHPDDRGVFQRLDEHLKGLNAAMEVRMRLRDGSYRLVDWIVAAMEDGWYATGRDVTEQRRVEEQLRQSQKMEAVGQLTGGMAHDFNNLLQAMSGCLQLIGRRAGHVAGVEKILDSGRQAVDRGASMIRQLMAFSRRQSLQPEIFDVRDRLLGMRSFLDRALRADIQLEFDLQAGLWAVTADPVQFELAVLNLATNARDAIPTDGRVVIGAGNVELDGDEGLSGSFVEVWVRDSGRGIAPEALHRVFEPFFTTKPMGKGTGLGLAQVYGFCRQSGGNATVESVEGRGTTVALLLPCAKEGATARELPRRAVTAGGDARVLLVEDDPVVAPVIMAALEDLGYRVIRAASGEEALDRLKRGEAVDLLFTDVVMPGEIDGVALARAARRLLPGLAVVLTTGYSEDRAGLDGLPVLPKPYRIEDLAAVIKAELERAGVAGTDTP